MTEDKRAKLYHSYKTLWLAIPYEQLSHDQRDLVMCATSYIKWALRLPQLGGLEVADGGEWPENEPGFYQEKRLSGLK